MSPMEKEIQIYTDGGCLGNPGPGGWAYVLITPDNKEIQGSGHDSETTNNRMELTAVIQALRTVRESFSAPASSLQGDLFAETSIEPAFDKIILHTDSQYVKNGITVWIHSWIQKGWKTAAKKPVKNKEYWIALKELSDSLPIEWVWVKGHAGNHYNELCDLLVQQEQTSIP